MDKITLILRINTTQRREHKQKQCGRVILVSGIQPSSVPFFDSFFSGNEFMSEKPAQLYVTTSTKVCKSSGARSPAVVRSWKQKKTIAVKLNTYFNSSRNITSPRLP